MADTWQEWATSNPSKMQANSAAAFDTGTCESVPAVYALATEPAAAVRSARMVCRPLPPNKLRCLRQRSADAHAAHPASSNKSAKRRMDKSPPQNALKRLDRIIRRILASGLKPMIRASSPRRSISTR